MQGRILEQYSEFYTTIYYFINGLSYITNKIILSSLRQVCLHLQPIQNEAKFPPNGLFCDVAD